MAASMVFRPLTSPPWPQASEDVPLTKNEALSGIFGSISLVAWIFVLIPQLLENYRQQSAAGVSILFILIWFVGDAANLAGAIWADLVPTVIAIAAYFCLSDILLVAQCSYYNYKNSREEKRLRSRSTETAQTEATEDQPLLNRRDSSSSIGLPGSHKRRRSSAASRRSGRTGQDGHAHGTLAKIAEEDALRVQSTARMEWFKNIASIIVICAIGAAGWVIAWKAGLWKPSAAPGDLPDNGSGSEPEKQETPIGAEILGYISAFLYLAARIPQIIKNWRDQSCQGLSLLFFLLSLLGNLTYGAGIIFHSVQKEYILINLPWLIGSLGTMAEDITIFVQFRIYGDKSEDGEEVEVGAAGSAVE